ncbi:MAG: HD domain-containing protein [Candidatus Sumerlaeota bacterium]|nr:HD domain-containing protein [Candidatus Sumerlaeota bacterium]
MKPTHQKILKILDTWMTTFGWDPEHMRQVARLSVVLFDGLSPLHRLDTEERFLLEAAAIVHDVGFLIDEKNHHKESFRAIMNADFPGLDEERKTIIALLARYHRQTKPKMKHKYFAALPPVKRKHVQKLAAILRIADGLDRSHTNAVSRVSCKIGESDVAFILHVRVNSSAELYAAQKKASLFEEVFSRHVIFLIEST